MVTKYGMSEVLGTITYGSDDSSPFLGKEMGHIRNYSEQTASDIDNEIKRLMSNAYSTTEKVLSEHLPQLEVVAGELMEKEKLDGEAFRALMRGVSLPGAEGDDPFESSEESGTSEPSQSAESSEASGPSEGSEPTEKA